MWWAVGSDPSHALGPHVLVTLVKSSAWILFPSRAAVEVDRCQTFVRE